MPYTETSKFVLAKDAALIIKYTPDYVAKLARDGEVLGEQRGRQWYVDLDSVKLFSLQKEALQKRRGEELREARLLELAKQKLVAHGEELESKQSENKTLALSLTVAIVLCVITLGGVGTLAYTERLGLSALAFGAKEIQESLNKIFDFSRNTEAKESVSTMGIVVREEVFTPEEIAKIQNSFSDDVRIEKTSSSTGVITPMFTSGNDNEAYHFVLVPVNEFEEVASSTTP